MSLEPDTIYRHSDLFLLRMRLHDIPQLDGPQLTMRSIVENVADKYGITVDVLRGPRRDRKASWPRQEAMFIMRKSGKFSLTQIGRYLGDRDHTTVIHGARRFAQRGGFDS